MKKPIFAFFLITTFVLVLPACAEIYKYVDDNGQKRWTDDLSQVPKDQRPSVQRMESVDETPVGAEAVQKSEPLQKSSRETLRTDTEKPIVTAEISREAIEKEQAELDTLYQELTEERNQLEQIKTEAKNFSERAKLNDRIYSYNSKTEQYETQLSKFNEKVKAYNQQIMSKQSN